jgi:TetR/AcrR family transcriptional regulator, transcriptional repressor for nem operon
MTGSGVVRPRRHTQRGEATRARIVGAAADLMYRNGVSNTSMDDVQAAAGVSASQIYHYFNGKQALTRAVIAHQTERVLAAQTPWLSRLDSIEALEAWRDFVIEIQHNRNCEGGCPLGTFAGELAENNAEVRADLAHGYAQWQTAIRDGLVAMRERGELGHELDPDRLSLALLAAIQGGLVLTRTSRDTVALEAVLDLLIDHVRCASSHAGS